MLDQAFSMKLKLYMKITLTNILLRWFMKRTYKKTKVTLKKRNSTNMNKKLLCVLMIATTLLPACGKSKPGALLVAPDVPAVVEDGSWKRSFARTFPLLGLAMDHPYKAGLCLTGIALAGYALYWSCNQGAPVLPPNEEEEDQAEAFVPIPGQFPNMDPTPDNRGFFARYSGGAFLATVDVLLLIFG
jgi:hypothetical protein